MRNVIVTGGSRGLGLAMSRLLSTSGYRVIAVARSETEELKAAAGEAAQGGSGALVFRKLDLSDLSAIPAFVQSLRGEFGALYGLVNNAGLGTSGVLGIMPEKSIERLVLLNTVSPIMLTKYVSRTMLTERAGRIVNIASIVASTGYSGLSVYSATKASLIGFTKALARELGPLGITVNAVSPGFIDTEMTHEMNEAQRAKIARRSALQRMAEAIDVARCVQFLLSESARNITGTEMTVDAGNTA